MTRLANWWHSLRREGVIPTGRRFISRFVYRSHRCLVTYSSVAGPPGPDHVGAITFRVAERSDLDRLQEFERYGRGSYQRRYIEKDKDWLFLACEGDRIVATRRSSLVIRDSVLSRVIRLGPGQFWGADLFCLPEYRNKNIARHLKIFGDRYLASLGYTEFVSSIEVSNTPSLRASRAAGRQALYYVSFVKMLWWERSRVSTHIPAKYWDALSERDPTIARCENHPDVSR